MIKNKCVKFQCYLGGKNFLRLPKCDFLFLWNVT
jgi:hypothetical protein